MPFALYPHNRRAYDAAVSMLQRTGKAAVVHPTGTGKSFIAFQLIKEHPEETFLWLTPSEYIFQTQRENLARMAPEMLLENVEVCTYARLMLLTEEQLAEWGSQVRFIILDEFHRCGAMCWGQGVSRLLGACQDAKLLGLSATNIRYLDNRRDMAEELFDGNIASEMTLGEAIVRGILPAPKYVTTVFRYRQTLEKYRQRIEGRKDMGLRSVCGKQLEALRRALEQAEGLDVVFQKHMTERSGKYLVFCSDYENLTEMCSHTEEWFSEVNKEIHVYSAYSSDPETSRAFAEFKADDSEALKLLFCIDMLNEGVHVKGISGVILFRPTVSPIVYKQQIGRALTAGESSIPLILDVVNNYEGLCSIGYLKEEMLTAVQRMYGAGEEDEIVVRQFEVIEQAEDCRRLFERLEANLSSGWEQYFRAAKEYGEQYGNLDVPKRYVTEQGLSLGAWISTQRMVRSGGRPGVLTEAQIARLDAIGMVWENRLELAWEKGFEHAKAYYEEYGNLLVPARYCCSDGFALGKWIMNLRQNNANGERSFLLNEERISRLNAIGMVWNVISLKWEQNYTEAVAYYQKNGDLDVPVKYKTQTGFALGLWICNLRRIRRGETRGKLSEEQISRLNKIGMTWGNSYDKAWEKAYRAAKEYVRKNGDLEVPADYISPDGTLLGRWVRRQRYARKSPEKSNAVLTPERIARLDAIGMCWEPESPWEHRYKLAKQYYDVNGDVNIPAKYKTEDGIWLGRWVYEQKRLCAGVSTNCLLLPEQRVRLAELGIT